MKKNDDDSVVEILAGATLGVLGGTVLAIPFYGFAPLAVSLTGLAALAAVGRAARIYREENKPSRPDKRSKRKQE